MISSNASKIVRLAAVLSLGLSLAGAPALAEKGGNGGGNGNAGGNGNGGGNSASHGKSGESHGLDKTSNAKSALAAEHGKTASSLGRLNGFLHASNTALAHASPKSAIGRVVYGYGGLLNSYLAPAAGVTPPTVQEVAAALKAASNKPLTEAIIAAVNTRLLSYNAALSANLTTSGKTADALAAEIAAAL